MVPAGCEVMSNLPEPELDLDLQFLPSWAKQAPSPNLYAKFTGEEGGGDNRRDGRRDRRPPPRRDGDRPQGARRPGSPGDRRDGGNRGPRDDRGHGGYARSEPSAPPREAPPPPTLNVVLMPDEKGVESIARQIKATGRAYPLFDIAQIILQKPERQQVKFEVIKKPDGTVVQPIFVCGLDETPWASEAEAVAHVLDQHFATFYQPEKTPAEPPKGTYTFVAQCGMSGVILGPPNYHDYQNQLRKLHAERFSRMAFEAFKSRVKFVKEEAVVKKWVEDLSWKTEYTTLNVPEPKRLFSREEVEKHFREVHLPNVIKQVESVKLTGPASREVKSPALQRLLRHAWEEQKRFPIKLVTILSQQFASRGLHFFKVNKTITHVSVARPHFLDLEATAVSDGVRKIVQFIAQHPRTTRRHLIEGLTSPVARPAAPTDAGAPAATPAAESQPTPEQAALISDLHWLIHQGHVIEFANGLMEMAKRPAPKPIRPEPAPKTEAKGQNAQNNVAGTEPAKPENGQPAAHETLAAPQSVAAEELARATAAMDSESPATESAPAASQSAPVESPEAEAAPKP